MSDELLGKQMEDAFNPMLEGMGGGHDWDQYHWRPLLNRLRWCLKAGVSEHQIPRHIQGKTLIYIIVKLAENGFKVQRRLNDLKEYDTFVIFNTQEEVNQTKSNAQVF
jgi:hypothetical protein